MKRIFLTFLIGFLAIVGVFGPEMAHAMSPAADPVLFDPNAMTDYDTTVQNRINETVADKAATLSQQAAPPAGSTPANTAPTEPTSTLKALTSLISLLNPFNFITIGMKIVGNIILQIMGFLVFIAGNILDLVITVTIVNLKGTLESLPVITEVWKVIRDFINLFFIFIVLYISIGTILGLESINWRKTLSNLVIAAIFMNFSLFLTKVVVDVSNVMTLTFYDQLPNVGTTAGGSVDSALGNKPKLSSSIMQSLSLQSIYNPREQRLPQTAGEVATYAASQTAQPFNESFVLILATVMGSVFLLVTAFVMLAGAWLFVLRFIKIVVLMIKSPMAFAGWVLPRFQPFSTKWLNDLQAQAIFPVAYMAMMWMTFRILQSEGFKTIAGPIGSFADIFKNPLTSSMGVIFNYMIIITAMSYCLIAASEAGEKGAEAFSGWLEKQGDNTKNIMKGFVGRNTLGRAAEKVDDKLKGSSFANKNLYSLTGFDGSIRDATTKAVMKSKFGSNVSFSEDQKKIKEIDRKESLMGEFKSVVAAPGTSSANIGQALAKMTDKEVSENLSTKDLDNPLVLGALNDGHFDAIGRSDKWSEEDKAKVKALRTKELARALDPASAPPVGMSKADEVRAAVRNMSDKLKGSLDISLITNPEFVKNIDSGSFAAVMKNGDISGAVKQQIKDIRYQTLSAAADQGTARREIGKFSVDEVAKIDGDTITRNRHIMDVLTVGMLIKMAESGSLSAGNKATIRAHVQNVANVSPELNQVRAWFTSSPANPYF